MTIEDLKIKVLEIIDGLNEQDITGHIYWNKFLELINEQ